MTLLVGVLTTALLPAGPVHASPRPGAGVVVHPLDGVWRMDGYGTVLGIAGGRLTEYETSRAGWLPGATALRTEGGERGGAVYTGEQNDTVYRLHAPGPGPHKGPVRHAALRIDGSTGERGLRRVAALPRACTRPAPSGPVAVFDTFWATFAENYPFFAAKGIDWQAVRDRYRPRVHRDTTDAELAALLSAMIEPLHDGHVRLDDGTGHGYAWIRPGTTMPGPELDQRTIALVEEHGLGGRSLTRYARGRITYADLPATGQPVSSRDSASHLGYLRISGFAGYTQRNDFAANAAELERTLDALLTPERTARLDGLIIDLRVNGGGSDALALRLASRLTDRPYVGYAKQARNDPDHPDRFSPAQRITVKPATGTVYTGPIAVLAGGSTFSAGEGFVQALMERPGGVLRIGEHTQGVFSDVLERRLPNGWSFGLPNEVFRTRTGRTFDGAGIPPQLREPVFTEEEFAQRKDSAFDRAVTALRGDRDIRSGRG
ncbi:S41 family peptidase [Streptomyces sp. NPDC046887]|uniref:S41 family peptidase n=1 Tax=Streptomyces sp. NPDC046887 TaxID=3155472 RepID=UPI0033C4C5A5